ncbi:uncharacterized protein LOC127003613 [Eriocheir sinensis]|uniref:uncharacterized protein LOC127003613 n=1 Tax=Eriocheir sinensis TaxID=95602 RepID=UPI0021C5C3E1|nr:uncharacterized protein LOC127003613 [Eriocheir sinensis]
MFRTTPLEGPLSLSLKCVKVLLLFCLLSIATGTEKKDEDEGEAKLIVKNYTTTTWTFLSSFISTVPYTCYTSPAAGAAACAGRRLKRSRKMETFDMNAEDNPILASSRGLDEEELMKDEEGDISRLAGEEDDEEKKKLFFRLWRTASSTVTVTSFSTIRSVTVSISIMCTYPNIVLNLC